MEVVNQVRIKNNKIFFGPGVRELMVAIDQTKSLTEASGTMELSYVKAHRMVHTTNEELGFTAIESFRGGKKYGGTQLTPEGREFLDLYIQLEELVQQVSEDFLQKKMQPFMDRMLEKQTE